MIKLTDILREILLEDRCKHIADRRYDKPSTYKSGAIVRCRKGKIWKDIKSEAFFIGEDGEELDEKKETLRTWFARKGAPGKTGGWVDCNTRPPKRRKEGKISIMSPNTITMQTTR